MPTPYYSTRNGKRILKGYRAKVKIGQKIVAEKYFGTREKSRAYVWEEITRKSIRNGTDTEMKLSQLLDDYISKLDCSTNGMLYAKKGVQCLRTDIPDWLDKRVTDFGVAEVSQMLEKLSLKSASRLGRKREHLKREVDLLNASFNHYKFTYNNEFNNPIIPTHKEKWANKGKRKKSKQRPVSHTEGEVKTFLDKLKSLIDPVYYHIAVWQLSSQRQRIGEVLSLKWEDVDWNKEIVWLLGAMLWVDKDGKTLRNERQTHTKEGRAAVPIYFGGQNSHLKHSLLKLRELGHSKEWIFSDRNGNVPTLRQMNRIYKKTGCFEEKYLGTHKCRKTAVTYATVLCGTDMAKTHAGHASLSAHVRYVARELVEISNPIPAQIADLFSLPKQLGAEMGPEKQKSD